MVKKMANDEIYSAILDGEVAPDELGAALAALRSARDQRDAVTTYQLIKDAIAGHRVLDDGYTLRILARLREHIARHKRR